MAKQVLPTNFMDDILNESMNGKRRWIITQNDDGTYTFEDATTYDQLGNTFGQAQVNEMNKAINESVDQARVIDDYKTLAAVNQNGFVPGAKPVAQLISDLGGCSLEQDGVDFYIVGADAVRKKLTGNDIYEIAYNEGNGWAGKGTIQLDVTNIPDYATLSLDSFKYVALLSSSGTGGATEEITGSYMGVKVLGYDSGSGKLSIQTANAYRPIFIVVIE